MSKWLLLGVLAVVAALWIVYGALKAINGIAYELELLHIHTRSDEREEAQA